MLLDKDEKVHIVEHQVQEGDVRIHYLGAVDRCGDRAVRIHGYVFVFDKSASRYVREAEQRTVLIPFDDRYLINILPENADLDNAHYTNTDAGLVVTDDKNFTLNIHDFGVRR